MTLNNKKAAENEFHSVNIQYFSARKNENNQLYLIMQQWSDVLIMRSSNYLRQGKRRQNRAYIESPFGITPGDKVCGKDSLASMMDVTITTIERWIRDGMPVEQRGDQTNEWIFDISDVKSWYLQINK